MEVTENEIRFIDLFSGIGGFRLGLERAGGYRCVWSNDFNKYANQIYTKNFGKTNHHSGDIKGVNPKDIPPHDLLCGGFPCQSFSVAGKRKGFEDTRGTLFFEICRVTAYHRPELLLLENVKGLLSHDGGRTFATILDSLEDLGYWWEYQVLNSKDYGVPQNRERVFIVGHLREGCTRPIFPITKSSKLFGAEDGRTPVGNQIASAITSDYHKAPLNRGENYVIPVRHVRTDRGKEARRESQMKGQDNTPYGDKFRQFVPSKELVTGTVTTGINKDALIGHNTRIRRLTPVECERLQGFPDGWTEWGIDENGEKVKTSDTQRYKALGNAVTVNVVEFLGYILKYSLFGVEPQSQSISTQAGRNGQSEPIGAQTDADATMGASPCPTDLSSYHARAREKKRGVK